MPVEEVCMSIAFPNESREYREARDALLQREVDLRGKWRPSRCNGDHYRLAARSPKIMCSTDRRRRRRHDGAYVRAIRR